MKYRQLFPGKSVFPVIRLGHLEKALECVSVAVEAGADGVFFTNHQYGAWEEPIGFYTAVRMIKSLHPTLWVGVNSFYGIRTDIKRLTPEIGGTWVDNAHVFPGKESVYARETSRLLEKSEWSGLYFGGVAFKYQEKVPDAKLKDVAAASHGLVDVITTSGLGTGRPPTVKKLRAMRDGAGEWPIAIASGIGPENVEDFLPYADAFIVNTSISQGDFGLDPDRTRLLVDIVHSWVSTTTEVPAG